MDIYKRAAKIDADYMDLNTGYIYKIQNYNHAKRMGLPTYGIEVVDSLGNHIGYAQKKED